MDLSTSAIAISRREVLCASGVAALSALVAGVAGCTATVVSGRSPTGTRYVPWAHNSNSYVQSIFRAAGANPYIPFTFAPPGL